MAIYAIGDIQGCFDDLTRLLEKIKFNPKKDQLWFTGDLVNRGPKSLETLRYVRSLGKSAITVLGNHDLHLLAADCKQRKDHKKDSLQAILEAPDREELLHWLRHQPLFHYNDEYCMLHAGVPPQWGFNKTKKMALIAEKVLQGKDYKNFMHHMYGDLPDAWSEDLSGIELHRFIINSFTRTRYCDKDGKLNFQYNGSPGSQPKHLMPWFKVPKRKNASMKIIFGHWSTLGLHTRHHCYGIDTGCLWGGKLTALKLEHKHKPKTISIDCPCQQKPGG